VPEAERQEIREIYASKGFAGDPLERVVDTITANRDSWLATMMDGGSLGRRRWSLPSPSAPWFCSVWASTPP